jgi:hypothetical protein
MVVPPILVHSTLLGQVIAPRDQSWQDVDCDHGGQCGQCEPDLDATLRVVAEVSHVPEMGDGMDDQGREHGVREVLAASPERPADSSCCFPNPTDPRALAETRCRMREVLAGNAGGRLPVWILRE